MHINEYLSAQSVVFLEAQDKKEAISKLVNTAGNLGLVKQPQSFEEAIMERENIVSTGLGLEVAIPHAKIPGLADFFIIVGILNKPIDWDSLDGKPVRVVFLIGGPENRQTRYLEILATLTLLIKGKNRREKLFAAQNAEQVLELFANL